MPLNKSQLATDLAEVFEAAGSAAEVAKGWADAVGAYASGVVPPSLAVSAAQSTLEGALAAAFAGGPAAPALELAFAAFAVTVAGGMAPTYTGVPPALPVGFAIQFLIKPPTHAAAGDQIATIIDTWMKTGTAVLVAPPNTPTTWT